MRARYITGGLTLSVLLGLSLMSLPSLAQGGGDLPVCPEGTTLGPKFEEADIRALATIDGVTITDIVENDEDELIGFSFESDEPVAAISVKAGGGNQAEFAVTFDPPVTEGDVDISGITKRGISHVHFCFGVAQTTTTTTTTTTTLPGQGPGPGNGGGGPGGGRVPKADPAQPVVGQAPFTG